MARKIQTQDHKQRETDNLVCQAGNHDVDACLLRALCVGGGRNRATSCLENKADNIARDERVGICFRLEACKVLAIDNNQPGETQVYRCGEESRSDGQADQIAGRSS